MSSENCSPDCDERDQCKDAGRIGHMMCGHCEKHGKPRHHCGCVTEFRP